MLSLLLALAPYFAHAVPLKIGPETAELVLVQKPKTYIQLDIKVHGKLRQSFPSLGLNLEKITYGGTETTLLLVDFDKDGYQEFLVRTSQPPLIGSLWVFRWDKTRKAYASVPNENGDRYIPVPLTGAVEISGNGELSFTMPESDQKMAYRWNGQGFVRK